jgi:hypothetical protein
MVPMSDEDIMKELGSNSRLDRARQILHEHVRWQAAFGEQSLMERRRAEFNTVREIAKVLGATV